jgi:hypothetical protein
MLLHPINHPVTYMMLQSVRCRESTKTSYYEQQTEIVSDTKKNEIDVLLEKTSAPYRK